MENLRLKFSALIMCLITMYSCNPNLEDENLIASEDKVQTEELIKLGDANLKAQEILLNMFQQEPDLRRDLLQIGAEEESIMLKTLFDPTTESFQRLSPSLLTFKDRFTDYYHGAEAKVQRTSQEKNEELEELIQTLLDGNIELYMPYIHETMLESDNLTIVAATLENQGNKVEGLRIELPKTNGRNSGPHAPPGFVDVDDNYADQNPTLILMPIDQTGGSSGSGSTNTGTTNSGSTSGTLEVYDSLYRMHVQVAEMKCTNQYDPLVGFNTNGGGSEFKFFRAKPEYNFSEDKVEAATYEVQAELTRIQIFTEKWIKQFVDWDLQWEPGEEVQGYAIYEWDNTDQEITINGNLKMNLDKKAEFEGIEISRKGEVSTGFTAKLKSKHSVLADQDYNRKSFYEDIKNEVNFGHGFRNGRAIRKAGSLYYTLNSNNYYND